MDKYTKFILTVIAIGIFALNFNLIDKNFISSAKADVAGMSQFDLERDRDFKEAVKSIVRTNCKVASTGRNIFCLDIN